MQYPNMGDVVLRAFYQGLMATWPIWPMVIGFLVLKVVAEVNFKGRLKSRWRSQRAVPQRVDFDFASLPVRKKMLMTDNEREFIARLERALPEYRIHSQVCMGAVMEPNMPRQDRGEYLAVRARFSQKIIDFIVEDRISGDIVAIIELDDITHDKMRDDDRDAMLKAAGHRTIRYRSRSKPTVGEIRDRFFPRAVA